MRVTAGGKSFLANGSPFRFCGLRYEPESTSADPGVEVRFGLDHSAVLAAGYTVVSLPPVPPSTIEQATASDLLFMLEFDLRDLHAAGSLSRRERARLTRNAAVRIRQSVQSWHGSDQLLLGFALTVPAPVGQSRRDAQITRRVADELAIVAHDEDPNLLVAARGEWTSREDCPRECDFLIVDLELTSRDQLAPALMAAHCDVGDRPLVLGSVAVHATQPNDSRPLPWIVDTALRCGVGGMLSDTWTPDSVMRDPETHRIRRRSVRDLDERWPSISIVINAYNAEATLDECLSHCERLDYPSLELIVVDDGSTDATPEIVASHKRARLVTIPHSGLAAGRNVGFGAAHGELIAYLDADAYPSPEWPWYLALASLGKGVAGSGGHNVPPQHEPASAKVVARSPGGPLPQLRDPTRAQHLPGCNMAFWRRVLEDLRGFDPVIEGAEDVEFEWRVADSGQEIGFHPAALVWHHRRPGLKPYLRQQRHYGRGQAILERRHPDRFPAGYRVRNALRSLRGGSGDGQDAMSCRVKYVTLPSPEPAALNLAHQWGMPAAAVLASTAPLAALSRKLGRPAATAAAFVGALFVIDSWRAGRACRRSERTLALRTKVAAFRLLRPLAFRWGYVRGRRELRRAARDWSPRPAEKAHGARQTTDR